MRYFSSPFVHRVFSPVINTFHLYVRSFDGPVGMVQAMWTRDEEGQYTRVAVRPLLLAGVKSGVLLYLYWRLMDISSEKD